MQHFDHKNAKDRIYPCSLWLSVQYGLFSPYSLCALSVLISSKPFCLPLSYPFFSPVHMQPPEMGRNKNSKASSSESLCLIPQNDPPPPNTHTLSLIRPHCLHPPSHSCALVWWFYTQTAAFAPLLWVKGATFLSSPCQSLLCSRIIWIRVPILRLSEEGRREKMRTNTSSWSEGIMGTCSW